MSEAHFDEFEHYNFDQEKNMLSGHSGMYRSLAVWFVSNAFMSASVALHIVYLLGILKVIGSMLGPNRVIAEDVKSFTYC